MKCIRMLLLVVASGFFLAGCCSTDTCGGGGCGSGGCGYVATNTCSTCNTCNRCGYGYNDTGWY